MTLVPQGLETLPQVDHLGPPPTVDYFSSGIGFGDMDNDGLTDLMLTSSPQGNVLLRNMDGASFAAAAPSSGISMAGQMHSGTLLLDYNNDGWRDVLILSFDGVRLFRNDGTGSFVDVSAETGLSSLSLQGESAAAGDIDGDGLLDIYLTAWFDIGDPRATDHLLHQRPNGQYEIWSDLLDVDKRNNPGFAVSMLDLDDDGDLDIYVVNDKQVGNVLWRNDGAGCGGWCFTDVSVASGAVRPVFGMGLGHGDYDHDGDLDLYFSSIGEQVLLRNDSHDGQLLFTERSVPAGVSFPGIGWGAEFVDFDNDGWVDIYLCTMNAAAGMGNRVYRNLGDGSFEDISLASGGADNGPSIGLAQGDYDDDGRVDVAIGNWNDQYHLIRNMTDSPGNWTGIRLVGAGPVNADAVGAKVFLTDSSGRRHRRDVHLGSGMGGSSDIRLHFGLGSATALRATIHWPDGSSQPAVPLTNQYQSVHYAPVVDSVFANDFE